MSFINMLSIDQFFSSVDSVYFDSLKSMHEEQNSNVNSSNIVEMIANNELSYPNNAIYHRQVCFFARNCLCIESSGQRKFPSRQESVNIIQVNAIPTLTASNYPSDHELMSDSDLVMNYDICIFSQGLLTDSRSDQLRQFFTSHQLTPLVLANNTPLPPPSSRILLIGFEREWSPDDCDDRLFVNRLRSDSSIFLNFALVSIRFDINCTPSLLSRDF